MSSIVIRIQTPHRVCRCTVDPNEPVSKIHSFVQKQENRPYDSFMLCLDQLCTRIITNESRCVSDYGLRNGSFIYIYYLNDEKKEEKPKDIQPVSKCNHGPNGRCIHCSGEPKKDEPLPWLCRHGPGQMCPNCSGHKKGDDIPLQMLCLHGPNAFCPNCLPVQEDTHKHRSFAEYMKSQKNKCHHSPNTTCNYCIPPSQVSYKLDKNCHKHFPFPRGICTSCAPKPCTLARQPYRHVDHVEMADTRYYKQFVQNWYNHGKQTHFLAFLYGKYETYVHNNYEQTKVVVFCSYMPKQQYIDNHFVLEEDNYIPAVENIIQSMGLECVGIMYTHSPREEILTSDDVLLVAPYQLNFKKPGEYGYKFVSVAVSLDKDNNLTQDAYMLSDQCISMYRDDLLIPSSNNKLCQVQNKNNRGEPLSTVIENKEDIGPENVTTFSPDWLLVQLTIGVPRNPPPPCFPSFGFPSINCMGENPSTLQAEYREIVRKNMSIKDLPLVLFDFNLLIYLSQILTVDKVLILLTYLKQKIPLDYEDFNLLKMISGL
ncbi:hypothetical protein WA158_001708 [Blastocystis sp. Blastoise]